jgi:hypothetical protein
MNNANKLFNSMNTTKTNKNIVHTIAGVQNKRSKSQEKKLTEINQTKKELSKIVHFVIIIREGGYCFTTYNKQLYQRLQFSSGNMEQTVKVYKNGLFCSKIVITVNNTVYHCYKQDTSIIPSKSKIIPITDKPLLTNLYSLQNYVDTLPVHRTTIIKYKSHLIRQITKLDENKKRFYYQYIVL